METVNRAGGAAGQRSLAALTVADIMKRRVHVAHRGTRVDVVASLMMEGFGSVPIIDEHQRLLGVVSEHDLLEALDDGQRWADLKAEEIMSRTPYSVGQEATMGTLIHVLKASKLIHVPVVDAQNRLVGIVARRDVVRACLDAGIGTNV